MRTRLVRLVAWLCFPFAAFAHIDYDRHVVFDNSLVALQPQRCCRPQRIGSGGRQAPCRGKSLPDTAERTAAELALSNGWGLECNPGCAGPLR